MKAFNQEKALHSRVLLRDCEIFANLRIAIVSSSNGECWLRTRSLVPLVIPSECTENETEMLHSGSEKREIWKISQNLNKSQW